MITKQLSKKAVEIWGLERQTNMVIEEVGEFLQAWNKLKRQAITHRQYVEEMVDCYIMFSQMRHLYGDLFEEILKNKIDRIERKIEKYERAQKIHEGPKV
jgi:NTP pyrophosphatase (non-canonical NTP hydrolase)